MLYARYSKLWTPAIHGWRVSLYILSMFLNAEASFALKKRAEGLNCLRSTFGMLFTQSPIKNSFSKGQRYVGQPGAVEN